MSPLGRGKKCFVDPSGYFMMHFANCQILQHFHNNAGERKMFSLVYFGNVGSEQKVFFLMTFDRN